MKNNIGRLDKIVRLLIGAIIIAGGAHLNTIWGLLGMIPVMSAQIGVCPMYLLFGINTNKSVNDPKI
jgi:hypothetical protein